jgi:hypothetical protein
MLENGTHNTKQVATVEWLTRLFFCAFEMIYPLDRGCNRLYSHFEQRAESLVLRAFCFVEA